MSGSAGDDLVADEMVAKLARYRHLMPAASPELVARMQSGTPAPAAGEIDNVGAGDRSLTDEATTPIGVWPALTRDQARDRALGCLLGLAVGDAVGAAVEFKPR